MKESLRRSQLEIFIDVLKVIKDKPVRLSHITLKAKINFSKVTNCISQLTEYNLIEERVVKIRKQKNVFYAITNKGTKFLKTYQEMVLIFDKKNNTSITQLFPLQY